MKSKKTIERERQQVLNALEGIDLTLGELARKLGRPESDVERHVNYWKAEGRIENVKQGVGRGLLHLRTAEPDQPLMRTFDAGDEMALDEIPETPEAPAVSMFEASGESEMSETGAAPEATAQEIIPASFDYSALDTETADFARLRADHIKGLYRNTIRNVKDIGIALLDVKAKLEHGQFGKWIEGEFAWSDRTAQNYMNVAEHFKNENISLLNLPTSALYLLAAPSTPEDVRDNILERAESGEEIKVADVKEAVETDLITRSNELAEQIDRMLRAGEEPLTYGEILDHLGWPSGASRAPVRRALDILFGSQRIRKEKNLYFPVTEKPAETEPESPAQPISPTQTAEDAEDLVRRFAGQAVSGSRIEEEIGLNDARRHKAISLLEIQGKVERDTTTSPGDRNPHRIYKFAPLPESASDQVADELRATFDQAKITLLGRTDEGAWHRAIEVARKLVAAKFWDGTTQIEFDAYRLHNKLFGVDPVDPWDLVASNDYTFVLESISGARVVSGRCPGFLHPPTADSTASQESERPAYQAIPGSGTPSIPGTNAVQMVKDRIIDALRSSHAQTPLFTGRIFDLTGLVVSFTPVFDQALDALIASGTIKGMRTPGGRAQYHFAEVVDALAAKADAADAESTEASEADDVEAESASADQPDALDSLMVDLSLVRMKADAMQRMRIAWPDIEAERRLDAEQTMRETYNILGGLSFWLVKQEIAIDTRPDAPEWPALTALENALTEAHAAIRLALRAPAPDWSTIPESRRHTAHALMKNTHDQAAKLMQYLAEQGVALKLWSEAIAQEDVSA